MNFKIFLVGEKIEKFYIEAIKEYRKRLSRYCKIEMYHFKTKEELINKLTDKAPKVLVSVKGQKISSEELVEKISCFGLSGISDIDIILGTVNIPQGELLAMSQMEMELGLQATILFEQIYRAYRIIHNQPYHK